MSSPEIIHQPTEEDNFFAKIQHGFKLQQAAEIANSEVEDRRTGLATELDELALAVGGYRMRVGLGLMTTTSEIDDEILRIGRDKAGLDILGQLQDAHLLQAKQSLFYLVGGRTIYTSEHETVRGKLKEVNFSRRLIIIQPELENHGGLLINLFDENDERTVRLSFGQPIATE